MLLALDAITALPTLPLTSQNSVFLQSLSQPEKVPPSPLDFQEGITAYSLAAKEIASMTQGISKCRQEVLSIQFTPKYSRYPLN